MRNVTIKSLTTAPATYDEFFQQWTPYVIGTVAQLGVSSEEADDVAQEIMLAFYERRDLERFDPDYVSSWGGRITFKMYVNNHIRVHIRRHRDKINKRTRRETSFDAMLESGHELAEREVLEERYVQAEREADVDDLRRYLASRRPSKINDLTHADVMDAALCSFETTNRTAHLPNFPKMGEILGISRNGALRWYRLLEVEIRNYYEEKAA